MFGFDKDAIRASSNLRIGTSGWNYPTGRGTWNGVFYPPSRSGRRASTSSPSTPSTSTPSRSIPRSTVSRGRSDARVGRSHAGRLRVLGQALSEVHAPPDVQGTGRSRAARRRRAPIETRCDALARPTRRISTSSGAGSIRWPRAASWARCWRSFRRASRTATPRDYLDGSAARLRDYRVAVELRHRSWSDRLGDTLALLNDFEAAWIQIDEPKFRFSIRQNLPAERPRLLLHAAARPERGRNGGATTRRKTATTTCTPRRN